MIARRVIYGGILLFALFICAGGLTRPKKSQSKQRSVGTATKRPKPSQSVAFIEEDSEDSELRTFSSEKARREEADRLFRLAQAYRDRNQPREAAETLEEVAEIAHDNPDAQYHAGMGHLEVLAILSDPSEGRFSP